MLDQYDAMIFDMDGTLIDSGILHETAWTETLNRYNIPVDRPLMNSLAGVPTRKTVELLIEKFSVTTEASIDEINHYKATAVKKYAAQYVKPTALLAVVKQFHGKVPMSIGTGASFAEAEELLAHCHLSRYMDHIVGADNVKHPKPAPDTFRYCAQLMGVEPSKCVVFEDSQLGLQAAKAAGMDGIDVLKVFDIRNDYFLS